MGGGGRGGRKSDDISPTYLSQPHLNPRFQAGHTIPTFRALEFYPFEVVSRYRDPQLLVGGTYSKLFV